MKLTRPISGESEKDFIARFENEMASEITDPGERSAVAYSVWRDRDNAVGEEYPTGYRCNFIEPGLVYYRDLNMTLLVRKPAIDKMRDTFKNRPVINETHREVTGKAFDFKASDPLEQADGIVVQAWNDAADGWDHCWFIVWDERTKVNIRNGYSVSCAYKPTQIDQRSGIHHNIPYDGELLDGVYTHLAIVKKPRYEGAKIIVNSEGGLMKIFGFFGNKKDKVEIKSAEGVSVKIAEGSEVSLKELVEIHNSRESRVTAPPVVTPEKHVLLIDDNVEIDGKTVAVKDLLNSYKADLEERANAEAAEQKKKDEEKEAEERRNADEKAEKERKEKEDLEKKERENSLSEDEKRRFETLKNSANLRGEAVEPKIFSREDRLAAGAKAFGSDPKK